MALRDGEQFQEQPQAVRRRSKDGPNAVDQGEWVDPDDVRPNQRTGRVIRGYWTMCPLRRIQRVSEEITKEHIRAAKYLRKCADVAAIGFSAPRDGMPVNAITYGPRLDHSRASHAQVRALDEFKRIWETLPASWQRMALIVVLRNHALPYWCEIEGRYVGRTLSPKTELGKLSAMMEHLANYLAPEIDAEVRHNRMLA